MSKPRTLKGFDQRTAAVKADIEKTKETLNGLKEGQKGFDEAVEVLANLEVELGVLELDRAKLVDSGTSPEDKEDFLSEDGLLAEDGPTSDAPKGRAKPNALLGKAVMVRCTSEKNFMVNPFNPNVKIVGHTITETVADGWILAQVAAGILVIRG